MYNSLKEHIKDGFDSALQTFVESPDYKQPNWEANKMFMALRAKLPAELQTELNDVINAFDNVNADLALEAYYRGVIDGAALRYDVQKGEVYGDYCM